MRHHLASGIIGARHTISPARLRAAWDLIGNEAGRHAGVHLLDDYDPDKRPIVMIHGLGASLLAWARSVALPGVGHVAIVDSRRTFAAVTAELAR